ncbi:hypothetical protein AVEN_153700-1 [Araneus ventricosus]|uniref:Uncharacterized protein n=1 Tax=Araneus ventricosus TaxID=182803 RepID=A0A4Y2G4I0_ARAVE|nr:hypothetical protein AVEN_153700-1 [Araneus ventricosus]
MWKRTESITQLLASIGRHLSYGTPPSSDDEFRTFATMIRNRQYLVVSWECEPWAVYIESSKYKCRPAALKFLQEGYLPSYILSKSDFCHKLRSNVLSFHKFRPRFTLFPVVGTGRIDVSRGLVSACVVSRVVAVNSSHIKGGSRGQTASGHPFTRALPRYLPSYAPYERLDCSNSTDHKCEPRVTRGLDKPHAVGTRLQVLRGRFDSIASIGSVRLHSKWLQTFIPNHNCHWTSGP